MGGVASKVLGRSEQDVEKSAQVGDKRSRADDVDDDVQEGGTYHTGGVKTARNVKRLKVQGKGDGTNQATHENDTADTADDLNESKVSPASRSQPAAAAAAARQRTAAPAKQSPLARKAQPAATTAARPVVQPSSHAQARTTATHAVSQAYVGPGRPADVYRPIPAIPPSHGAPPAPPFFRPPQVMPADTYRPSSNTPSYTPVSVYRPPASFPALPAPADTYRPPHGPSYYSNNGPSISHRPQPPPLPTPRAAPNQDYRPLHAPQPAPRPGPPQASSSRVGGASPTFVDRGARSATDAGVATGAPVRRSPLSSQPLPLSPQAATEPFKPSQPPANFKGKAAATALDDDEKEEGEISDPEAEEGEVMEVSGPSSRDAASVMPLVPPPPPPTTAVPPPPPPPVLPLTAPPLPAFPQPQPPSVPLQVPHASSSQLSATSQIFAPRAPPPLPFPSPASAAFMPPAQPPPAPPAAFRPPPPLMPHSMLPLDPAMPALYTIDALLARRDRSVPHMHALDPRFRELARACVQAHRLGADIERIAQRGVGLEFADLAVTAFGVPPMAKAVASATAALLPSAFPNLPSASTAGSVEMARKTSESSSTYSELPDASPGNSPQEPVKTLPEADAATDTAASMLELRQRLLAAKLKKKKVTQGPLSAIPAPPLADAAPSGSRQANAARSTTSASASPTAEPTAVLHVAPSMPSSVKRPGAMDLDDDVSSGTSTPGYFRPVAPKRRDLLVPRQTRLVVDLDDDSDEDDDELMEGVSSEQERELQLQRELRLKFELKQRELAETKAKLAAYAKIKAAKQKRGVSGSSAASPQLAHASSSAAESAELTASSTTAEATALLAEVTAAVEREQAEMARQELSVQAESRLEEPASALPEVDQRQAVSTTTVSTTTEERPAPVDDDQVSDDSSLTELSSSSEESAPEDGESEQKNKAVSRRSSPIVISSSSEPEREWPIDDNQDSDEHIAQSPQDLRELAWNADELSDWGPNSESELESNPAEPASPCRPFRPGISPHDGAGWNVSEGSESGYETEDSEMPGYLDLNDYGPMDFCTEPPRGWRKAKAKAKGRQLSSEDESEGSSGSDGDDGSRRSRYSGSVHANAGSDESEEDDWRRGAAASQRGSARSAKRADNRPQPSAGPLRALASTQARSKPASAKAIGRHSAADADSSRKSAHPAATGHTTRLDSPEPYVIRVNKKSSAKAPAKAPAQSISAPNATSAKAKGKARAVDPPVASKQTNGKPQTVVTAPNTKGVEPRTLNVAGPSKKAGKKGEPFVLPCCLTLILPSNPVTTTPASTPANPLALPPRPPVSEVCQC